MQMTILQALFKHDQNLNIHIDNSLENTLAYVFFYSINPKNNFLKYALYHKSL